MSQTSTIILSLSKERRADWSR